MTRIRIFQSSAARQSGALLLLLLCSVKSEDLTEKAIRSGTSTAPAAVGTPTPQTAAGTPSEERDDRKRKRHGTCLPHTHTHTQFFSLSLSRWIPLAVPPSFVFAYSKSKVKVRSDRGGRFRPQEACRSFEPPLLLPAAVRTMLIGRSTVF